MLISGLFRCDFVLFANASGQRTRHMQSMLCHMPDFYGLHRVWLEIFFLTICCIQYINRMLPLAESIHKNIVSSNIQFLEVI